MLIHQTHLKRTSCDWKKRGRYGCLLIPNRFVTEMGYVFFFSIILDNKQVQRVVINSKLYCVFKTNALC